jgi:flagellar biosynthesis GTPase FlhF
MPIAEVESWLEELIAALPGFDVCIVADSHMDAFELELLMQRCSNVGATILMLTKVDELLSSGRLGSLLSIPGLPAVYLTESTTITSPPLPAGRRELRGIGSQGA